MKKTTKLMLVLLAISCTIIQSCKKDDDDDNPTIPNEEEVITTIKYTLVNTAATPNDTAIFIFKDLNEDGDANDANEQLVVDSLAASATYSGTIEFLNELESPADTVTNEIKEEAEEHQVFYSMSGVTISYTDKENTYVTGASSTLPVGITTSAVVGSSTGTQSLTITLRHEPDKNASGVSGGNITNAGGETDITTTFSNVKIY